MRQEFVPSLCLSRLKFIFRGSTYLHFQASAQEGTKTLQFFVHQSKRHVHFWCSSRKTPCTS